MNTPLARPFRKLLVANRGEIALRVMRTARTLGIRTVAVYSDADARAPHVGLADEAVCIGPAPASESYLRIDRLLDAAARTATEAIHPGYGFLSERADFAEACEQAGLVFVGPPAAAIATIGNKAAAKARMQTVGVPCVPGWFGQAPNEETLMEQADRIGLPLLVKAVAGGGGRGMRLVHHRHELKEALASARREAEQAFGDGTLMLERLVTDARHIEVQVFADHHGRCIHLGERDCTAQRRRQKVIEESPSPTIGTALRERLCQDAVAAARAVSYANAGTVEFVVDREGKHFFLEMNTRLQVEHPVTEAVTGLDLVEWQLRVAMGEPLPLAQNEVTFTGHAIEARLYAEDPVHGFAPQAGPVLHWRPGKATMGREASHRIDSGIREGGAVTPHYDAMVAKLIVHGRDRNDARRRLAGLLEDAPLIGVRHNAAFLRQLVDHPAFVRASLHTTQLDAWLEAGEPLVQEPEVPEALWALAAAVLCGAGLKGPRPASVAGFDLTLVRSLGAASSQEPPQRTLRVEPHADGCEVAFEGQRRLLQWATPFDPASRQARVLIDGVLQRFTVLLQDDPHGDAQARTVHIAHQAQVFSLRETSARPSSRKAIDPSEARAPVAGTVVKLGVQAGQRVEAGTPLVCVEAMKMEMWQRAAAPGTVRELCVQAGDRVTAGAVLVCLDLDAATPKA
jgi:acetyl/propionyl-CoA carboxylase alpha subunit